MFKFRTVCTILFCMLSVTACQETIPKCGSSETLEVVESIVKKHKNDVFDEEKSNCDKWKPICDQAKKVAIASGTRRWHYEEENCENMMAQCKEHLSFKVNLENIRTTKIDKDIKKIFCEGEVKVINSVETQTFNINYTAQYNEDGRLFVSVAGLPKTN